jgi:PRTRC genetic system protein A
MDTEHPWDCILDPAQRIVLAQTPLIPMPTEGGLAPLDCGRRRYIGTRDGTFIQCRNEVLAVTLRMDRGPLRPFGELQESVELKYGPIPFALFEQMRARAIAAAPSEWAGLVHWHRERECYVLTEPETELASPDEIHFYTRELDPDWLVLNVHSHGFDAAYFSDKDDASDNLGVYFAAVLGHCVTPATLTVDARLVVEDFHYPITWRPWALPADEPCASAPARLAGSAP